MASPQRTYSFNTGNVLLEASLEGEFDAVYNYLNGTTAADRSVNGNFTVKGGTIDVSNAATAVTIKDNTDAAFAIKEGTNERFSVDTTDGSEQTNIEGNAVIKSDQQLTASDFPNATTLYGWNMDSTTDTAADGAYAGTKFGTDKDLTLKAQKLTAANDVLGNSKYNTIIAGGYLQSTDTVFNVENTADTDDFMVGGWVYIPDTTPAATVVLFSNTSDGSDHGWYLGLVSTGNFVINMLGATDTATTISAGSTAGWRHIILARDATTNVKLYLDGKLAGVGADTTVGTTQSKFQLGGGNGAAFGLPEVGTRYDECFFKKGVLPTNLDDVVKQIYARSAKKFAVKDANTNIYIPELNVASGVYTPTLTNTTNISASTAQLMTWTRVGQIMRGDFHAFIDPTINAATVLTFTLPIACSATPTGGGQTTAYVPSSVSANPGVIAMASATTATVTFHANEESNREYSGTFWYVLN